jgi:hypothetical protein
MRTDTIHGHAVLFLDAEGPSISTSEDASDLVGSAWSEHATLIAIPVARLDPAFFRLETRLAGEVIQKLVNYRLQLAILGDIEEHLDASGALRDFVWESNRGEHVWFLADEAALEARLTARPARSE